MRARAQGEEPRHIRSRPAGVRCVEPRATAASKATRARGAAESRCEVGHSTGAPRTLAPPVVVPAAATTFARPRPLPPASGASGGALGAVALRSCAARRM
eukprot:3651482-Prymnesium_polylepis.1